MSRKLFGTDGVRGRANSFPMTAEMALRLGAAAGRYFRKDGGGAHRVVIGKDTRLSGRDRGDSRRRYRPGPP